MKLYTLGVEMDFTEYETGDDNSEFDVGVCKEDSEDEDGSLLS